MQRSRKNMTHNEEDNQSIKTELELTQTLDSSGKDPKTVNIIIFHVFRS